MYLTAANNIEVSIPVILALIAGQWTDIHGRKWPMFVSALCFTVTSFLYYMLSTLPKVIAKIELRMFIPEYLNLITLLEH